MNRHEAERRGRGAETLAFRYLRLKGWRILARRARVPGGEVDIVARWGRMLAFVEVKVRANEDAAASFLDQYRLRRVADRSRASRSSLYACRRRRAHRRDVRRSAALAPPPDQRVARVTKS